MAREMKNSGVRWIGEIPSNWDVSRIKYIANNEPNSFTDGDWIESPYIIDNGIRYLTSGNVGEGKFKRQGNGYISEQTFVVLGCKYAYPGDLIFSRLNAPFGRSCILPDDENRYVIAVDNVILRTKEDKRYVCYFTQTAQYQQYIELLCNGMAMQRIARKKMGDISIPLPPFTEQKVIADFLDAKCGEIDGLLADLDAEVKTLTEYKKSIIAETVTHGINQVATKHTGISWIGDIPSSWDLKRLQFCIKEVNVKNNPIQTDFVLSLTIKDGVLPYDEKGDIGNKAKENHADYKLAFPDTIVLNSMNILIGAVGISKYFGCVSPVYYVFKNHEDCDLRYINYVLSSISFQKYLRNYAKGILEIRLRVSAFDILKQKIPVPSLDEQIEIANYLDSKCAAIDQAITDKTQQIETLKSYKSSLIYEYVTGKKQDAI